MYSVVSFSFNAHSKVKVHSGGCYGMHSMYKVDITVTRVYEIDYSTHYMYNDTFCNMPQYRPCLNIHKLCQINFLIRSL